MKLHYNILSTYSHKALLAFYEKGVEFTPAPVNLMDPAARAEYRKLYPLGKVPLLTGDDLFIPESSIIVEYLENTFGDQGICLIPHDKVAARRVRFSDRMADQYLNEKVSTLFFDSRKPPEKRNPEAVSAAREVLDTVYGFLEQQLKDKPYVQGDALTMADLAHFGPLFYAQQVHPYADKPLMTAYFQRLMQRPSAQRLMAELGPVLKAMQG